MVRPVCVEQQSCSRQFLIAGPAVSILNSTGWSVLALNLLSSAALPVRIGTRPSLAATMVFGVRKKWTVAGTRI